ncbi:MAG: DUF2835 domain-containing protein [Granulosicoccus sp.]
MIRCRFKLFLTPKQFEPYYSGQVKQVVVQSEQGLRLALPASELRKFVTRDGICGRFEITYNAQHKLVSLEKLSS